MNNLTPGQIAFLDKMESDHAFANWGFEKLASREDRLEFFHPLYIKRMFDAQSVPSPEPADKEGSFRIPYWPALTYLEKVAEDIDRHEDVESAKLMMEITQQISNFKDKEGKPKDNYHTWHSFSIILSHLPLNLISEEDIRLLDVWLGSQFGTSLVGSAIGKELLPKLLKSDDPTNHRKAEIIIECITRLKTFNGGKKVVTAVESYWLNDLFKRNINQLGRKCGLEILATLRARIEELQKIKGSDLSYRYRPAIEDHEQNNYREGAFNDLITAYRDVLHSLIQCDVEQAREELDVLLNSDVLTECRIAYHIVDKYFDLFAKNFWVSFSSSIFVNEVHHELYLLLKNHFHKCSKDEKSRVLDAIRNMPQKAYTTDNEDEALRYHKMDQRHWLYAIQGQKDKEADELYAELSAELGLSGMSAHPEFLIYSESSWGPGPAKYEVKELVHWIRDNPNTLIEKLNEFEEPGTWKGPTIRAQTDLLTEAVKKEPIRFIDALPRFLKANPPYQYAVINGLKNIWDSGSEFNWQAALNFCWMIIESNSFWEIVAEDDRKESSGTPMAGWIVTSIADLVRSGLVNDDRAIEPDLMSKVKFIMERLLEKSKSSAEGLENDAMTEAINTQRGHCLELLFSYALRSARLEDKMKNNHSESWEELKPIFDRELSLCADGNFEFSTLAACYLPQILCLNADWLGENVTKIFSQDHEKNWHCAIQGMAYIQQFYQDIYIMLRDKGILEKALEKKFESKYAREKLLQFIGVAYLNGEELFEDESSLMSKIIRTFEEEDIAELAGFFWMQRDSQLDSVMKNKVIEFWYQCSVGIQGQEKKYERLLSKLALLTVFISEVTDKSMRLLTQSSPYVAENYNTDFFLDYITPLAKTYPTEVGNILYEALENWGTIFDSKGLIELLKYLSDSGEGSRNIARNICNLSNIRNLKEIQYFYKSLEQ